MGASEYRSGHSWVGLDELLAFDYAQTIIDQRGAPPHSISYLDFLGGDFMGDLDLLKTLGNPGDVRVLFCFDI